MSVTELDGLVESVKARHQRELEALEMVRGLAAGRVWTGPVEAVAGTRTEGRGLRTEQGASGSGRVRLEGVKKTAMGGFRQKGKESKTAMAARDWMAGLKGGSEFTVGELAAKVCAATGVAEETVKIRMYAWLGSLADKGEVTKVGVGRWRKEGVGGGGTKQAKARTTNGGSGEAAWNEKMERLRLLKEEVNAPAAAE